MEQRGRSNSVIAKVIKYFSRGVLAVIPIDIARDASMFMSGHYGVLLRQRIYKKMLKRMGNNVNIREGVVFKYPENIELGNNVFINEYCYLNAPGGIKIGNDVSFAIGVRLISFDHFYNEDEPIWTQGLKLGKIVIEDDVWIGVNAVILKGVKIGKGSIIGAGSVVTRDVPKNSIAIGNPARVIKRRK